MTPKDWSIDYSFSPEMSIDEEMSKVMLNEIGW